MAIHIIAILLLLWIDGGEGGPVPMQMVDMTHVFDNTTVYQPQQPPFVLNVVHNETQPGGFWLQIETFSSGTHVGTHMDAPCHLSEGKWCLDHIPIERFIAPAAVIDVTKQADQDRDYLVTIDDIKQWEDLTGQSLNGTIVLIHSGWGKRWPDREAFTGTPNLDATQLHNPGVSPEASQWLVDNRDIIGLGTECLSIDNGLSRNSMTHQILLGKNIFAIENIANMDKIPIQGATLYAFPMNIGYAGGAPARVMAKFPQIS